MDKIGDSQVAKTKIPCSVTSVLDVPTSGKCPLLQEHSYDGYLISISHSLRHLNYEYSEIHPQQPHFLSHSLFSGLTAAKKGFQCIINTCLCACLVGLLPRLILLKHNTRNTTNRIIRAVRSARFNINMQKIKRKLHCSSRSYKPVYLTQEDKAAVKIRNEKTHIKRLLKVRSETCKAPILQGLKDCSIGPPARVHRSPSPLINTSFWSRNACIAALSSSPTTSLAECFRTHHESMKTDEQQQVAYQSNNSRELRAHGSAIQAQHTSHHNTVSFTITHTPRFLRRRLVGAWRELLSFFRAHFRRQWRCWNAWAAAPTLAGALARRLSLAKTSSGSRAAAAQSRFEWTAPLMSTWHVQEARAAAVSRAIESITLPGVDQFLSRLSHKSEVHLFGSGLCTTPIVYIYNRGTCSAYKLPSLHSKSTVRVHASSIRVT